MAAWRYEISLLLLKKYFTRSLRSLMEYFSTLEEKFRISTRPCNILYSVCMKNIQGSLPLDCEFSFQLFLCCYQKSSVKLLILLVKVFQSLVMVLFF